MSNNRHFNLSNISVVLLALLPSLVFYLFVPFTWNNTDAGLYFFCDLNNAVPHYPPLYNSLCRGIFLLSGGSAITINIIVFIQHFVYAAGLLYVASLFPKARTRIVFLLVMAFNPSALVLINGIFPEGLYAGFQLFFWGAFFRFLIFEKGKFKSGIIWAVSLSLLTLTKNIGELYYALPVAVSLVLLVSGGIKFNGSKAQLAGKLIKMTMLSLFLFLTIQHSVLFLIKAPNKFVVGRQASYRIKELAWDSLSVSQRDSLITHYTSGDPDPMLRKTFETIIATRPWVETADQLDSLLALQPSNGKNADDYLNMAFKHYLLNLERHAISCILRQFNTWYSAEMNAVTIIKNSTLCMYYEVSHEAPGLDEINSAIFTENNFIRLSNLLSSGIFQFFAYPSASFLVKINLLLFCLTFGLSIKYRVIFCIPMLYALFYMIFNCVITIWLDRYAVPSHLELHLVGAILLAALFTSNLSSQLNFKRGS